MNRERAKELLPIIQAYSEGAEIQTQNYKNKAWLDLGDSPAFADGAVYRVKPEPRVFELWLDEESGFFCKASEVVDLVNPRWKQIKVQEIIE